MTIHHKDLHPALGMYAEEHKAGQLSRREFLARATALGVSSVAAYAAIGATPAKGHVARQTRRNHPHADGSACAERAACL